MINLLEQKYYEYDNAFYKRNANISCSEQMKYQAIRKYNIDYFLLFCDDINVKFFYKNFARIAVKTNHFEYNNKLFTYINVTTDALKAEKSIEEILKEGNVVIFKTAMDYLHTCIWYHEDEPFTRFFHNAIIIGCDNDNFFYVDAPPMRNSQYFKPHPKNAAVGYINRSELIESFRYHCEIGYLKINVDELKHIANIRQILMGIKDNFYTCVMEEAYVLGEKAIIELSCLLNQDFIVKNLFVDFFPFDLIAARHKILKICLWNYKDELDNKVMDKLYPIISELMNKWYIIKNMVIKMGQKCDINIQRRIGEILAVNILPMTQRFVENLEYL